MTIENMTKLKATHAFTPDKDFPVRKYNDLEIYANVADVTLKRAPKNTLEGEANRLIVEAERAEQAAIRANPPVYDRSYVERATYSITELYADLAGMIRVSDVLTWADYPAERRKWRKCKHKFCLDYFPIDKTNHKGKRAKPRNAVYCCNKCRYAARDAELRFKNNGSYLPEEFYIPRQADSVGDDIRAYEYAAREAKIERALADNKPANYLPQRKPAYGCGEVVVFKSLEDAQNAHKTAESSAIIA